MTKSVGAWRQMRLSSVDACLGRQFAGGGVHGALAGAVVLQALHARFGFGVDASIAAVLAGAMLLVAAVVIACSLIADRCAHTL